MRGVAAVAVVVLLSAGQASSKTLSEAFHQGASEAAHAAKSMKASAAAKSPPIPVSSRPVCRAIGWTPTPPWKLIFSRTNAVLFRRFLVAKRTSVPLKCPAKADRLFKEYRQWKGEISAASLQSAGDCVGAGGHCTSSNDCCGSGFCEGGFCDSDSSPGGCAALGGHCASSNDCCGSGFCSGGFCQ